MMNDRNGLRTWANSLCRSPRASYTDIAAALVGRVLLCYLFVGAAIWHLSPKGWPLTLADMESHHVPFAAVSLVCAMLVSSMAALALLFNWKVKWAAFLLAGYSVVVSAVLHNPIHPAVPTDFYMFVKDLGIAGALLIVGSIIPSKQVAT